MSSIPPAWAVRKDSEDPAAEDLFASYHRRAQISLTHRDDAKAGVKHEAGDWCLLEQGLEIKCSGAIWRLVCRSAFGIRVHSNAKALSESGIISYPAEPLRRGKDPAHPATGWRVEC